MTSTSTDALAARLASAAVDDSPRPGSTATITGLKGRSELNGKRVSLLSWAESSSRWATLLHHSPEEKGVCVKPLNLKDITPPSDDVQLACLTADVAWSVFDALGLCALGPFSRTCSVWRKVAAAKVAEWTKFKPSEQRLLTAMGHASSRMLLMPSTPPPGSTALPGGEMAVVAWGGVHIIGAGGHHLRKIGATMDDEDYDEDDDEMLKWEDGPHGLASDGEHLFVAEMVDGGVRKIDPQTGKVLAEDFGLYSPTAIATAAGKLFVMTSDGVGTVLEAADLSHLCTFGEWPDEGLLGWRGGLAATASRLYVADPVSDCIDVLALPACWSAKDARPQPLARIGGTGGKPGQFRQPRAIAVMGDKLFVAEFKGMRLQVLSLEGVPQQVIPTPASLTSLAVNSEQVLCGCVARRNEKGPADPGQLITAGCLGHIVGLIVFSAQSRGA